MKANLLRNLFLDFFKSKEHKVVSSSPMVVKDDPTLMFTNAGMNQFKDIFLNNSTPKHLRVANSQKCLRVSGKHNDLEEVGHDIYHHTMFEMLGSWSFGDYFKEDAIKWSWEFLTDVCKLDKDRLYVTVFEGSNIDNLAKDDESFSFWKKYLPEERILNGSKDDNFWEMGNTGPCGPSSEIHYDNRDNNERKIKSGALLVNKDHPEVIEIWNLVFIEYNRFSNGSLKLLPNKHVDTGMGFERLLMIMQGLKSNYETDIFQPIIHEISQISTATYGVDEKKDIAMRVIADHIRAISFSIADGQLPSNVKAGYVIRRILRRAVRYGYTFLDLRRPFMYELVDVLSDQMGSYFTEISAQKELIKKVIKQEEDAFLRTLDAGLKRIEELSKNKGSEISGRQVFELYDTYGFPLDLTELILSENNLKFNKEGFLEAMQEQKNRSKKAAQINTSDWKILIKDETEEFIGYTRLEAEVKITKYRKITLKDKQQYQLVFDLTPFYPEGGGQIGDSGIIENSNETILITDTKKENNLIVHISDCLPENLYAIFTAKVNIDKRMETSRNHTATHLLQESLIKVLGRHVEQKGSFVHSDYLRFDFIHFSSINNEDLLKIELDVNSKILSNINQKEHIDLPLKQASDMGAIMLFGEKYDDVVRMIQFGSSKELCGGTHVGATGEIGLFKIISQGAISSGVRRIEAMTGSRAFDFLYNKQNLLNSLVEKLKVNNQKDLLKSVDQLIANNKKLQNQIKDFKKISIAGVKKKLLESVCILNDIRFVGQEVEMDSEDVKKLLFSLRNEKNLAMILASKFENKAVISIMLTDDLIAKGFSADKIIKEISLEIKGGGGGQPFFATAGGSFQEGIGKALKLAEAYFL